MSRPDRSAPILVPPEPPKVQRAAQPPYSDSSTLSTGLLGLGVVLFIIGWVDLGLLLWPPAFGRAEWEFGVITGFFAGLPVATMGTTLVILGARTRDWRWLKLLTRIIPILVCVGILALAVLFALDITIALKATPPEMKTVILRSIAKTAVFAACYLGFYAWLVWFSWGRRERDDP